MASKEPDDDDEWCEKQNVETCSSLREWIHGLKRTWWRWRVRWKCYWDSDQTKSTCIAPVVLGTSTYVCFVRTGRNFCLMASSPYGCFDWILQCKILTSSYDAWNALEVHTASEIHTPLGIRENARSWLFDWSKPTDGATKLGQTPRTHCGVMASKRCEWCHSLRLISWVAWQ